MNRISLVLLMTSFVFIGQPLFAILQTPEPLCRNVSFGQIDIERCAQEIMDFYDGKYLGELDEDGIISRELMIDKYMEMVEGLFIGSYDPFCLPVEAKVEIVQNDCNGDEVDFSWDMETPDQIDLKYLNLRDGIITDKMSSTNRLNILLDDCAFDKLYVYNVQCGNGKSGLDVIIIIDADIVGGDDGPEIPGNGRPIGYPNSNLPYQGNHPGNTTSLSFSLAPNPISDTPTQLQITTSKTQNSVIQIEVHNALGKRMYTATQEANPNSTQTQYLPTADLPTGLYFVTLRNGEEQITQRLVKRE